MSDSDPETTSKAGPDPSGSSAAAGVVQLPEEQARKMAMACHLLSFLGLTGVLGIFTHTPIPILGLLGPMALWLWKRDQSELVNRHGREAVNFNLTLLIYSVTLSVLSGIGIFLLVFAIGILLLIPVAIAAVALFVFWFIVVIQAAVNARDGKDYDYPMTFRFIK